MPKKSKNTAGRFIVFEGPDGAGKSTQVALLAARLRTQGIKVTETREVGGSSGAEAIRSIWLSEKYGWDLITELLLIFAARRDHIQKTILPALQRGEWVVCDRFIDSTRIYQGAGQGGSLRLINMLARHFLPQLKPDLTVVLQVNPSTTAKRRAKRGGKADRYEQAQAFQKKITLAFKKFAVQGGKKYLSVDAEGTPNDVARRIWQGLSSRLKFSH